MPDIIYAEKCVGCRSCEIACSYHHQKLFSRVVASIEVRRWEKVGKFAIVLHRQNKDGRIACDGCGFCLAFCPQEARDELRTILGIQVVQR